MHGIRTSLFNSQQASIPFPSQLGWSSSTSTQPTKRRTPKREFTFILRKHKIGGPNQYERSSPLQKNASPLQYNAPIHRGKRQLSQEVIVFRCFLVRWVLPGSRARGLHAFAAWCAACAVSHLPSGTPQQELDSLNGELAI
eukprot:scaffold133004_cov72-Attheya_sp.AAC.5